MRSTPVIYVLRWFWQNRISAMLLFFVGVHANAKPKWEEVNAADLTAIASSIWPGADAEILFSRHVLDSSAAESYLQHYVRVKIYTRTGIERLRMFTFEYYKGRRPDDIMARVVKPNRTSFELAGTDIRETTSLKYGADEWIQVTFSTTAVEPGDVVEYRWSEPIFEDRFHYRLFCDSPGVPTREYSLDRLRPRADLHLTWLNVDKSSVSESGRKVIFRNLPPFVEEPLMPPASAVRKAILLLFSGSGVRDYSADEMWQRVGAHYAAIFDLYKEDAAVTKATADELLNGVSSAEDRIRRLYEFVQHEINNLENDRTADSADARNKRKKRTDVQSPATTLKRKSGTARDINRLFAALVSAAGFRVSSALYADHETIADPRISLGWVMMDHEAIAVRVGDHWEFYTPGVPYVPCGMLRSQDAGTFLFLCDLRKSWWEVAPTSPATASWTRRNGQFTLLADGSLSGTVEISQTGHRAIKERTALRDQSPEQRLNSLRDALGARFGTATITNARWENLADNAQL